MPQRPQMVPPVGKSGPGMISISSSSVDLGVVDQGDDGVADLAEVVRRDARRHADGDPARAVDQQVGELARQDPRLLVLLVVVRLEVDGVEVDVLEHLGGDRAELRLGVPHGGGRGRPWIEPKFPCPVISRCRMFHHWAIRASVSDRSSCRRAGGTASSSRRRSPRTCWSSRPGFSPGRASPSGCAAATASARRGRRAGPG